MPPIRAVTITQTAFSIDTISKGVISFAYAGIPAAIRNGTIAGIDTWLDAWFVTNLSGNFYARAHVFQKSPLIWTVMTSTEPIPDGWWQD